MIVGFAGSGSMARAIALGLARAPVSPRMLFNDLEPDRARSLAREVRGESVDRLESLAESSDVVFLAVKPQALAEAASGLGAARCVVSVLAATPLERLRAALGEVELIVRLMPSQPAQVGAGVSCYSLEGASSTSPRLPAVVEMIEALGPAFEIEESLIDPAMAVMSCAPAYLARMAASLAAAGSRQGLPRELADRLVAETIAGTGALLGERGPEDVEAAVAPRGGATEAGLEALEEGGFSGAIDAAVSASLARLR